MVRAKFRVSHHEILRSTMSDSTTVVLSAVYDDGTEENKRYAKYTPSGTIKIVVDNPAALEQFKVGQDFYVDFTEVQK